MKSIQSHLVLMLASWMVVLSVFSGGTLYYWLRHSIVAEFDRSLALRAHALESLVTQTPSGRLDVDIDLRTLREFDGPSATEYFLFEDASGTRISSSNNDPLTHVGEIKAVFWNSVLPNGTAARAFKTKFKPSLEGEANETTVPAAHERGQAVELTLTVARNRQPLIDFIVRIALAITVAAGLFSLAAVVAAVHIVRKGLVPLAGLSDQVRNVDLDCPPIKFATSGLPLELTPIVDRLNEMLSRVYQTIAKERQFTSAVSHELRTPIAELRAAVEVALRDPSDVALSRRALDQAGEIAVQMQTMVATLLEVASSQRAAESLPSELVRVHQIIERAIHSNRQVLDANTITVNNDVSVETEIPANPVLLLGIAENLVKNAANYARRATTLHITCTQEHGVVAIRFDNETAVDLTDDDVSRMFDPFWRKDVARSGGENFGLGLTVVRAYCAAMGARVQAQRTSYHRLMVELRFTELAKELSGSRVLANSGSKA